MKVAALVVRICPSDIEIWEAGCTAVDFGVEFRGDWPGMNTNGGIGVVAGNSVILLLGARPDGDVFSSGSNVADVLMLKNQGHLDVYSIRNNQANTYG